MMSLRNRARVVGALFVLAAVTSIVGLLLYGPILNQPDYVLQLLPRQAQIATGATLEIVLALSMVGIGIGMYPLLSKHSQTLALGYMCFRLLESTIVMVGILSLLSLVTLSNEVVRGPLSDPASLLVTARMLVALHDWTFLMGPNTALGVSTLMMSFLLFRAGLVPRWISALGLLGGPLIFLSSVLVMYGLYEQTSVTGALAALPVFLYEMSIAVYLMVRGFKAPVQRSDAAVLRGA